MPLVEHDDVVEALTPDRADHPFDERILPGRPRAVRTSARPKAATVLRKETSKMASRSCSRNRDGTCHGNASRSCCRVHVDVGCGVTLTCRIRRRSCARTTKTNNTRHVIVGTVKKSTAASVPTWF